MATFKVRVEDKIGSVGDDAALSDFLTAGAKFIVNILPAERVEKFTSDLTDAGAGISVTTARILRAHKSGYGARKIDAGLASQAVDSGSIHFSSIIDPVWYILNGVAFVKPFGGTVVGMAYPTVAFGDSTITAFPADLDEGVVLYASIHGRLRQMSDLTITTLGGLASVISVSYTNVDTALTNQDIELASGHLNKVQTQISEFSSRIAQYSQQYQQLASGLTILKSEFNDYIKSI